MHALFYCNVTPPWLREFSHSLPAPTLKLQVVLADDTDGEGISVSWNKDSVAAQYEIYRGVSTDPGKTDVIPAMTLLKTTQRTDFVDDDVIKGQRMWYKVRSVNPAGTGPWSEPVSHVM